MKNSDTFDFLGNVQQPSLLSIARTHSALRTHLHLQFPAMKHNEKQRWSCVYAINGPNNPNGYDPYFSLSLSLCFCCNMVKLMKAVPVVIHLMQSKAKVVKVTGRCWKHVAMDQNWGLKECVHSGPTMEVQQAFALGDIASTPFLLICFSYAQPNESTRKLIILQYLGIIP